MNAIILRNTTIRFSKIVVPGTGNIWSADHATDLNCDAIGVGRSRVAAVRKFFEQIAG